MEIILQILAELVIQVLGEALAELGLHALAEPFRKPPNPWLASLGYLLFGCMFGGLSLLIISHHITTQGPARIANLVITPLAIGVFMAIVGRWRAQRGDRMLRIDGFFYGYLFALGFALVRFALAK